MTKEEMIKQLEGFLSKTDIGKGRSFVNHKEEHNKILAMDLLASLKGWKTHICNKQSHSRFPSKVSCPI